MLFLQVGIAKVVGPIFGGAITDKVTQLYNNGERQYWMSYVAAVLLLQLVKSFRIPDQKSTFLFHFLSNFSMKSMFYNCLLYTSPSPRD